MSESTEKQQFFVISLVIVFMFRLAVLWTVAYVMTYIEHTYSAATQRSEP